jgi:hypothetical protein
MARFRGTDTDATSKRRCFALSSGSQQPLLILTGKGGWANNGLRSLAALLSYCDIIYSLTYFLSKTCFKDSMKKVKLFKTFRQNFDAILRFSNLMQYSFHLLNRGQKKETALKKMCFPGTSSTFENVHNLIATNQRCIGYAAFLFETR